MKGCLGCFGAMILLFLLVSFPLFTIGLGLVIWGIYERTINRKIGASSKKPAFITALGIIIVIVSLVTGTPDPEIVQEDETVNTPSEHQEQTEPNKEKDKEEPAAEPEEEANEQEKAPEPEKESDKDEIGTITSVVDGDTIRANINGTEETIRLLLVDTPETKHPDLPTHRFGPEASEFAKDTLTGEKVEIEYDGPRRDKYDRLLAYVWIDGNLFNEMLLEEGLARYAYVYDPPYTHAEALKDAEETAQEQDKGIWSLDGYVTEDGFAPNDSADTRHDSAGESAPSTPTADSPPDDSNGNVYYENCSAAHDANAAPVRKGDPGYGPHLDRDGDGIACES